MPRTITLEASYQPLPAQAAFHRSQAKVKGYGGAMGGGKSRALCEEAFQAALDYPGIEIVIARQEHTAISISTRKTMFREVLPPPLVRHSRVVKSGGFDFIELPNGSFIHFVGLNDPVKFHSSEIGLLVLDEAHQIDEEAVMTLNTRLRQKCADCQARRARDCDHLPRRILCGFNPENPGHWLYRWFVVGAVETQTGYYKPELRLEEDAEPIGDAEFVRARAIDNPYLPTGYVERELGGMKDLYRRRYLEGEWLFVSGECFFDTEALTAYRAEAIDPLYRFDFRPAPDGQTATIHRRTHGLIAVWEEPIEGIGYAIGADTATGAGTDYSAAYVIRLDEPRIVAEFHGKLDADLYAAQLHFLGRWYQTALIAVEQAGGYGEAVTIALRDGREGRPPYPRLYQHVLSSRPDLPVAKPFGYPINVKTRPLVLNQLEKMVRERALPFMPTMLIEECLTFVEDDERRPSPAARPGCNDDRVMAAAIACELYRLRGHHPRRERRLEHRRSERKRLAKLLERDPFYFPPLRRRKVRPLGGPI